MKNASPEKWEQCKEGNFVKDLTSRAPIGADYLWTAHVNGVTSIYLSYFPEPDIFNDDTVKAINFEPTTLLVPKGFQFVPYTIDPITIGTILSPSPQTITTPILLNINGEQCPTQLDPCEKLLIKTQNGCAYPIKYNSGQYYALFKYEGLIKMDDRGVTKDYNHYFMPMLLPNMAISWYAFPIADGVAVLDKWHTYAMQNPEAIIGLKKPMSYSDPHMMFVTEDAELMK